MLIMQNNETEGFFPFVTVTQNTLSKCIKCIMLYMYIKASKTKEFFEFKKEICNIDLIILSLFTLTSRNLITKMFAKIA